VKSIIKKRKVNGYVVGPNLELQRYDWLTGGQYKLGLITPNLLTKVDKATLVSQSRISWDVHVAGCSKSSENNGIHDVISIIF
jgi:hypothetical protein